MKRSKRYGRLAPDPSRAPRFSFIADQIREDKKQKFMSERYGKSKRQREVTIDDALYNDIKRLYGRLSTFIAEHGPRACAERMETILEAEKPPVVELPSDSQDDVL